MNIVVDHHWGDAAGPSDLGHIAEPRLWNSRAASVRAASRDRREPGTRATLGSSGSAESGPARSAASSQTNSPRGQSSREDVAQQAQAYSDRVAAAAEFDAAERRITELYISAVNQLGSNKAAVRLGGLYALERLAQNNHGHRQTIVDVICATCVCPPHRRSW